MRTYHRGDKDGAEDSVRDCAKKRRRRIWRKGRSRERGAGGNDVDEEYDEGKLNAGKDEHNFDRGIDKTYPECAVDCTEIEEEDEYFQYTRSSSRSRADSTEERSMLPVKESSVVTTENRWGMRTKLCIQLNM